MSLSAGMTEFEMTDPEFAERFAYFAGEEVPGEPAAALPARERYLAILAALLGCQGAEQFRVTLAEALDLEAVTPIEAREVVYQGTAYLGIGRTRPFFSAMNEVFAQKGVELPPPAQGTTTLETRGVAGNQKQIDYFGEHMRENWKTGPAERANVNLWLAENCFGDYYTRGGLSDLDREMVTFCYLVAQGGCEPQATAHAGANLNLGRTKDFLYRVVMQILPYIGYPRSLNALSCIDNAAK
ncbi:carboxymuconolactone decarboxylase family protein [Enorma burkinafasonensis]|uniref:carboxymuconolactone decarboxylase family protein n=1 Tax=Enorma burkinafasonensis TaxID=2590867 RepID=UPI001FE89D2C|nr:carboxymuconolactone decarboxylase family protein [Enorma burkinafasonensis]